MRLRPPTSSASPKKRHRPSGPGRRRWAKPGQPDVILINLGADTCVVCDGHILGKPVDSADARRMLQLLVRPDSRGAHRDRRRDPQRGGARSGDHTGLLQLRNRLRDCAVHRQRRAARQSRSLRDPRLCCSLDLHSVARFTSTSSAWGSPAPFALLAEA